MTLSAAILAGGRATRYDGRDKGALIVDGRSIRERQIAELSTIAGEIFLVGLPRRSEGAKAGGDNTPGGLRHISDRIPGGGPLGGLYSALVEATGDVTIVVACDMPFLSAPLLRHLAACTRDADAAVPRTSGGYHPLCAAYTRACVEPAARRLADGRLKMTDLFDDVRVRAVADEELAAFGDVARLLANVNSPDDYRELTALQTHQP